MCMLRFRHRRSQNATAGPHRAAGVHEQAKWKPGDTHRSPPQAGRAGCWNCAILRHGRDTYSRRRSRQCDLRSVVEILEPPPRRAQKLVRTRTATRRLHKRHRRRTILSKTAASSENQSPTTGQQSSPASSSEI